MSAKQNREEYRVDIQPNLSVTDLLLESEQASRAGNNQYAYELILRATQAAPDNIDAWLLRVALSPSFEERLLCVNRLNELAPDHHDRYNLGYFTLKELLDKNPFLAYLEETETLYRVMNGDHMVVSIRKKRAASNPSMLEPPSPLKPANRWLIMAILGLMFAGLGTLIFAPLAALTAIQIGQAPLTRSDQINSVIVLILAVALFLVGIIFSLLFIVHWIG